MSFTIGWIILLVGWGIVAAIKEAMYRQSNQLGYSMAWGILSTAAMIATLIYLVGLERQ